MFYAKCAKARKSTKARKKNHVYVTNTYTMSDMLRLLLTAIAVAENAIVYNFTQRLVKSKCVCSEDWRREAITLMTVFNFVALMIGLMNQGPPPSSYVFILGLYSLAYFFIVLTYTHGLWNSDCECSEGMDRAWIYITRVVDMTIFLSVMIIALLVKKN